jgi:hypothetical protein
MVVETRCGIPLQRLRHGAGSDVKVEIFSSPWVLLLSCLREPLGFLDSDVCRSALVDKFCFQAIIITIITGLAWGVVRSDESECQRHASGNMNSRISLCMRHRHVGSASRQIYQAS